jgi:hypothetical protein
LSAAAIIEVLATANLSLNLPLYGLNDSLVFGGNGVVYRALEGHVDDVDLDGTNGVPIVAEAQQAFNYFDMRGANKHYKMFRPTFVYERAFEYRAGANMDFDLVTSPSPSPIVSSSLGYWDTSKWDSGAVWVGGTRSDKRWVGIVGIGYAASVRIATESDSSVLWVSTDWIYEKGGIV